MADYAAIKIALKAWVDGNLPTGVTSIFAKENAAVPSTDYVTLLLGSASELGQAYIGRPDAVTGSNEVVGQRVFTLTLQAFSSSALDILEGLRGSFGRDSVRESLAAVDVAMSKALPIVDTTSLEGAVYVASAAMDVQFNSASIISNDPGVIETAQIFGSFENENGEVVFTDNLDI